MINLFFSLQVSKNILGLLISLNLADQSQYGSIVCELNKQCDWQISAKLQNLLIATLHF